MHLLSPPKGWSQEELHHVHASEEDDGGQQRVCPLMEDWVLQIVIVKRDEDGE